MTEHSEAVETKVPPRIVSEEDVPFDGRDGKEVSATSENLAVEESLDTRIKWKKLSIGSNTLGWCIGLMVVCMLLSIWKPENELIQDAFEAFKLIVLTVLGYIFGSNAKE